MKATLIWEFAVHKNKETHKEEFEGTPAELQKKMNRHFKDGYVSFLVGYDNGKSKKVIHPIHRLQKVEIR